MGARRSRPGYPAGRARCALPHRLLIALLVLLCALACRSEQRSETGSETAPAASPASSALVSAAPSTLASAAAASVTRSTAPVRLAFVGDINMSMLVGRNVARVAKGLSVPEGIDDTFPFTAVRDRLLAADIAVGNLECVVSLQGTRATAHNPFRAPLEAIGVLRAAGFDILSVANNHTRDFGRVGLRRTRHNLLQGGITPIGAFGATLQESAVREVRGVRVAFLAYYNIYKSTPKPAYRDVAHARAQADVVVVFNHWGSEKHPTVQLIQRRFGRGLIDAGAHLVVGTHVHVLQPEQWYRGRLIFYGLGNFVFNGMNFDEAHRTGGYLEVDVDESGVRARRFYQTRLDEHGAPRWLDTTPREPERLQGDLPQPAPKRPRGR